MLRVEIMRFRPPTFSMCLRFLTTRDSTTLQKLQIRLIRQSRGFEALARVPPCEMFSRDPPQLRINQGDQSVRRFSTAVVPPAFP
jgi:hypothetical protein